MVDTLFMPAEKSLAMMKSSSLAAKPFWDSFQTRLCDF
jgi:hypothetical protein